MTRTRLTALALLGALSLTGLSSCGGTSPDVERREALNDVVSAALRFQSS